jgi:hypothetical protein
MRLARALVWVSSGIAVFMAFGWPFAVDADPASAAYRSVSIAALCSLLGAVAFIVAGKARGQR